MKKTTLLILLSLALGFGFLSCGDKYGDVKQLLTDYINMTDVLNKSLDDAKDNKAVVAALNNYTVKMKEISPRMESMAEKYPDLDKNTPAELKDLMTKFEESTGSYQNIFAKIMNYMSDPEVMQAVTDLTNVQ
jgi:hypothetical protein